MTLHSNYQKGGSSNKITCQEKQAFMKEKEILREDVNPSAHSCSDKQSPLSRKANFVLTSNIFNCRFK
jgi:hypothetical protein